MSYKKGEGINATGIADTPHPHHRESQAKAHRKYVCGKLKIDYKYKYGILAKQ